MHAVYVERLLIELEGSSMSSLKIRSLAMGAEDKYSGRTMIYVEIGRQ